MEHRTTGRGRRRAWLAALAVLAVIATAVPAADAGGRRDVNHRVVVCHERSDGEWKRVRIAPRAVPAHVRRGGVVAGDPVPGMDSMVFDRRCRPVFHYARSVRRAVNDIRRNVDPPCDVTAPDSPCGPENGGVLPRVKWNQDLAELAAAIADSCPIFVSRDTNTEDVHVNVFLHFSPTPITEAELAVLAISNWGRKSLQYDPVTGTSLRPGDLSAQIYSSMLWADEVGMSVNVDCPDNRSVAVMFMSPGHGDGPAYPPVLPD